MLGVPDAPPGASGKQHAFINEVNRSRLPWSEELIARSNDLRDGATNYYSINVHVAYALKERFGYSWLELYDLMDFYGTISRRQFPERLGKHLLSGSPSFLLPLLLLIVVVLVRRAQPLRMAFCPLFSAAVFMIVLHIIHLGSLLTITPINMRYFQLTFVPAAGAVMLLLVAALYERRSGVRRETEQ